MRGYRGIIMQNWKLLIPVLVCVSGNIFAYGNRKSPFAVEHPPSPPPVNCIAPHGWSFDIGGQYTWMALTTPPTFQGSTGGATGKITYQLPQQFFGQLRSIYNVGSLSSSSTDSSDNEWYSEFVAGYCFKGSVNWTMTPYLGIGLDFLNAHQKAYSTVSAIHLHYRTYYALFGLDFRYAWTAWYVGLQVEALPVFHQYLSIGGLSGAAWKMTSRVGVDVQMPIGFKLSKKIFLELAPYYRFLPIGASNVLGLPHRNLNQWGAFLTFRFCI